VTTGRPDVRSWLLLLTTRMYEVVARFIPVLSCTAVTSAFEITAQEASLAMSERPAVWAATVREETRNKKINGRK
jgi:hypothetical protein